MTWLRRWLRILGSALGSGLCAIGSSWEESAWLGYGFPLAAPYPLAYPFRTDARSGQPNLPWDEPATDSG